MKWNVIPWWDEAAWVSIGVALGWMVAVWMNSIYPFPQYQPSHWEIGARRWLVRCISRWLR